jgi:5-methylcytosine-specific restriction enzyme A
MMPPHRCPSCHQLVTGRCPCRLAWTPSQPVQRIRGRRLQRLRDQLFSRQPLCVLCLQMVPPRYTIATIRDHVVNLADGGRDDESNEQAICEDCHATKTAAEAHRGRLRNSTVNR